MAISTGDKTPSVSIKPMADGQMKDVTTDEIFSGKKVVLFAVPGAFTPTCSAKHLPGFVEKAADLKGKGVDEIACTAVNDAFVMGAWAKSAAAEGVTMLADGNGHFAEALGLSADSSKFGMGTRSKRYSMIVNDGVIEQLNVEQPGAFEVSSADYLLERL